jgi:hypothetical protein
MLWQISNIADQPHLDLADVNLAVLFTDFCIGHLHSVQSCHSISQVLCGHCGRFHVEALLLQLLDLTLVSLKTLIKRT